MDSEHCNCSIINPRDSSAPPKTFSFDSVYNIMATTEQIYSDIVYPLVEVAKRYVLIIYFNRNSIRWLNQSS